jgi:hypothetical protein
VQRGSMPNSVPAIRVVADRPLWAGPLAEQRELRMKNRCRGCAAMTTWHEKHRRARLQRRIDYLQRGIIENTTSEATNSSVARRCSLQP